MKVRECWAGSFNDYPVAIFTTRMLQGESWLIRTAVAVQRPASAAWASDIHLPQFLKSLIQVDVTSTPGWVIASFPGPQRRRPVIQALLQALCKH